MKKFMVFIIGPALFFSGCGGPRIDLVETGKVSIETEPGERVNILNAYVYQDGEETVVSAAIRRKVISSYPLKIQVSISVVGPDGATYLETEKEEFSVLRYQPGRSPSIKFYRKRISEILPDGSVVKLICQ